VKPAPVLRVRGGGIRLCIKPDAFGNALGSSLASANSTEKLRSAENLAQRSGMTQTALGELNTLAEQYGGHDNIPYEELKPYIGIGRGNNSTIGALYDNEATQKGFVGTRLGAPLTNTQIDLPEFTVAPDLTVNVTGSSDMLYQAGRAIAVSGGVVAGMFQNIGDGIIGAGKLVYDGLQAQQYIMLGGDNSVNRYMSGFEGRQESFENFKSYGSAMRTIASDPVGFLGNAVGHIFDGIQSALSTAESTTNLGDWFLYGASVGHATMGIATAVAGGVGLARSAVSGIGALRAAVGARITARTAALDVSQNPFGVELSRGGPIRMPTEISLNIAQLPNDLAADAKGVYGYLPKPGTQFSPEKWSVDWTNPAQVADARTVRIGYHENLAIERNLIEDMKASGVSDEGIARKIVDMRNQTRMSMYSEDQLPMLFERNMKTYQNPFGPTYETQLLKYGTPLDVIKAGTRSNPTMDILTGIGKVKGQ